MLYKVYRSRFDDRHCYAIGKEIELMKGDSDYEVMRTGVFDPGDLDRVKSVLEVVCSYSEENLNKVLDSVDLSGPHKQGFFESSFNE